MTKNSRITTREFYRALERHGERVATIDGKLDLLIDSISEQREQHEADVERLDAKLINNSARINEAAGAVKMIKWVAGVIAGVIGFAVTLAVKFIFGGD